MEDLIDAFPRNRCGPRHSENERGYPGRLQSYCIGKFPTHFSNVKGHDLRKARLLEKKKKIANFLFNGAAGEPEFNAAASLLRNGWNCEIKSRKKSMFSKLFKKKRLWFCSIDDGSVSDRPKWQMRWCNMKSVAKNGDVPTAGFKESTRIYSMTILKEKKDDTLLTIASSTWKDSKNGRVREQRVVRFESKEDRDAVCNNFDIVSYKSQTEHTRFAHKLLEANKHLKSCDSSQRAKMKQYFFSLVATRKQSKHESANMASLFRLSKEEEASRLLEFSNLSADSIGRLITVADKNDGVTSNEPNDACTIM